MEIQLIVVHWLHTLSYNLINICAGNGLLPILALKHLPTQTCCLFPKGNSIEILVTIHWFSVKKCLWKYHLHYFRLQCSNISTLTMCCLYVIFSRCWCLLPHYREGLQIAALLCIQKPVNLIITEQCHDIPSTVDMAGTLLDNHSYRIRIHLSNQISNDYKH